jgi:hypothetical protein
VNGTSLLVGGVLNGQGVVNSYSLPAKGAPVLQTSRNLGNLQGGSVTGLAVSNGQVIVAGTTHNPALNAGTITAAAGTGSNAFVASLNANLAPSASDSVAYYAGQGNTTATALSVVNGDVYIAGNTGPKITAAGTTETGQGGYLAQVNPTTGAVGWSTALNGPDGIAAPVSISAASGGASVLDQLGLPSGTISQTATDLVTAATPVKSGSSFYIQAYAGAPLTQVTVTATDTLQTLATKIAEASNNALTVTVLPSSSKEKLTITATGSVNAVQILAGPSGSNALDHLEQDDESQFRARPARHARHLQRHRRQAGVQPDPGVDLDPGERLSGAGHRQHAGLGAGGPEAGCGGERPRARLSERSARQLQRGAGQARLTLTPAASRALLRAFKSVAAVAAPVESDSRWRTLKSSSWPPARARRCCWP